MPVLAAERSEQTPFLLPWERITSDPNSPELFRLIRHTTARRIGLLVSAVATLVAAAAFATVLAIGADDSLVAVTVVSILVLMVAGVYLVTAVANFVSPSVVVLTRHEVISTSLLGTRRLPLATMTGMPSFDTARKAWGLVTTARWTTFQLRFAEGRPLTLQAPRRDYDVREIVRHITGQWFAVRRAEVLGRLNAGETITMPRAFVRLSAGRPHFFGAVELGPAGVRIDKAKRESYELSWSGIDAASVDGDGVLAITGARGAVVATIDQLIAPAMVAANISDYRANTATGRLSTDGGASGTQPSAG